MKWALKPTMAVLAGLSALALVSAPVSTAAADERSGETGAPQLAHMGAGGGGDYAGGMHMNSRGMKGRSIMGSGHRMGPGMMGGGHGMGAGMAGQDCPQASAKMGQGQNMGSGMLGRGYGMVPPAGHQGMMGSGMRVVPQQDLTIDDVRHFFEDRLARHGNRRLKIGEVKQADDDSITADIVTADNSLVRRFKVNRHTGRMQTVE